MEPSQIIIFVILILLAGFFAGITVAFTHINKLKLEIGKRKGELTSRVISRFNEEPVHFMATGMTGFIITLSIYCILTGRYLYQFWLHSPLASFTSPYIWLLAQVIVASIFMLIFGLLIPRSLFRAKANQMLVFLVLPIAFFNFFLLPLTKLISRVAAWVLKYLFNVKISEGHSIFQMAGADGYILKSQPEQLGHQNLNSVLFENALSLPRVKVRTCMIPRKEVESLDINSDIETATQKFVQTQLSKLVIYENNIDNILGYIHQLELFTHPENIRTLIHPMMAVPETMSAIDLLTRLTQEHKSIAWVIDEFGGTAGIVTLEDLLEEIFGEIRDEHDKDELVEKQIAEKEYILSGRLEMDYLNKKYAFKFPETESETLSGFIISNHETIPKVRERIIIDDFEFDIINVTETRIEMVKMRVLR